MGVGGLDGVVVCDTRVSRVDGLAGELLLAGVPVASVAARASVAWTAALLWGASEDDVQVGLAQGREAAWVALPQVLPALQGSADAGAAVRAALAFQAPRTPSEIAGSIAVFVSAWCRVQHAQDPIPPDPTLAHGADLIRMIRGRATRAQADALAAYLSVVSDHGMNASTFTARVVASTGADTLSGVLAAFGALMGPLHGGAPGPVLDMLDAVGSVDMAPAWVARELQEGRRIMGMGHRVYRVRDPRAAVLEDVLCGLEGAVERRALARAVELAAEQALAVRHPERPLRANVEFYTALLLEALGVPRAAFTALFAAGRVLGWCAHIEEQQRTGRLIRPRARYVGVMPPATLLSTCPPAQRP
jgi:citrate synthase